MSSKQQAPPPKLHAVIDIGSNSLRMKIAQVQKSNIIILESLRYPLALGRDTFTMGKISYDTILITCDALSKFKKVLRDYGLLNAKVVATSALREAANKDFVLDQIEVKTGLKVEILDDMTEKSYIYKVMLRKIKGINLKEKKALLVYIGAGNVGICYCEDGLIKSFESIKIGSLRIAEQFLNLQDNPEDFFVMEEEYFKTMTSSFIGMLPISDIDYFVVSGRDIESLRNLCQSEKGKPVPYVKRSKFIKLYEEIKTKSIYDLIADYDLSEEKAEVFLPSVCIYKTLLTSTKAEELLAPTVYLIDGLIYELAMPKEAYDFSRLLYDSTKASVKQIAIRYQTDMEHVERVKTLGMEIFNKLKKDYGLTSEHEKLFESACYLHEIGKFVNIRDYDETSYFILKNTYIIGFSDIDIKAIGSIVRNHLISVNSYSQDFKVKGDDTIFIPKLRAILMIADSLDAGFSHKFEEMNLKLKNNKLTIIVETNKIMLLEKWTFEKCAAYFQEVFGLSITLKQKRVY